MIVDAHFHLLADSDVPGCKMSDRLKAQPAGALVNLLLGTTFLRMMDVLFPDDDPAPDHLTSDRIRERLLAEVARSRLIDGVVLLGMDARWNHDGTSLFDESDLVVSNKYVLDTVARHRDLAGNKHLYAGTSIHPFRPEDSRVGR